MDWATKGRPANNLNFLNAVDCATGRPDERGAQVSRNV